MTGVFIRRGDEDKGTHSGNCEDGGTRVRTQAGEASTSQAERPQNTPLLLTLDLRLPAPRTGRE